MVAIRQSLKGFAELSFLYKLKCSLVIIRLRKFPFKVILASKKEVNSVPVTKSSGH